MSDPAGPARARLVVLQGSTQSLTASAAVAERETDQPMANLLMIGGLASAHADSLTATTVACCSSREWEHVVSPAASESIEALRAEISDRWVVEEVLAVRNWQPLNEVALNAFPQARRVIYGDALGFIEQSSEPGHLRFHEAMAVLPHPATARTFDDLELRVVPRERMLEVIEATRAKLPDLVEVDRRLAEFARDGLLLLPSYLTEVRTATRRGEIEHLKRLVRAAAPAPGAPIVIKPHPRASLGQAASLARHLRRRGHPVRVLSGHSMGHYPIELFSETVRAVRVAEGGASASIVGLRYLYGTDARATDVYRGQWLSFKRSAQQRLVRLSRSYTEHCRLLPSWDMRSPLPPPAPAPETDPLSHRVHRELWRLLNWRPLTVRGRRPVPLATAPEQRLGAGGIRLVDPDGAAVWWLPSADEGLQRQLLEAEEADPLRRLLTQLGLVAGAFPSGCEIELRAAVLPPSHAPSIESALLWLAPVPVHPGARLTAQEIEDAIESEADVLEREPPLERARVTLRGPLAGHVSFRFRVR